MRNLRLLTMAMMIGGLDVDPGYSLNRSRNDPSSWLDDIDVAKEVKLIKAKKSNLSASKRKKVLRIWNNHLNQIK